MALVFWKPLFASQWQEITNITFGYAMSLANSIVFFCVSGVFTLICRNGVQRVFIGTKGGLTRYLTLETNNPIEP